jgi:hypothetical protein
MNCLWLFVEDEYVQNLLSFVHNYMYLLQIFVIYEIVYFPSKPPKEKGYTHG